MTLIDRWGESLSTGNRTSADRFEEALTLLNGFYLDPLAVIDSALAEDPEFVMGHIFRASLFLISTEKPAEAELRRSLETAERLASRANARERGHMAALRAWLEGDYHHSAHLYGRIVQDHPRDILALQVGHQCDFFLGQRDMLRDRVAWVLPHWNEEVPGFNFVLGMHAFGLEETNLFAEAEDAVQRALALEPRDPWTIHAQAHVYEMQGRLDEGVAFLRGRADDWAPDNMFAYHNWWHLGLYHLDRGEVDEVLRIYDTGIRPASSSVALELVDAAAMLWRLHLRGVDVGNRWDEVADTYETMIDDGYYVFNDVHAMMAFIATGRGRAAERLVRTVERAAEAPGSNGGLSRDIGLPLCRALLAFGAGRYAEAANTIIATRPHARRFGGSNAQRDVLTLTAIEAALRGGQRGMAQAIAAERLALKPEHPFNRALADRAAALPADTDAAA